MFGYVRVNNAELKVKEYEFYRGTYCGLCRAMGKCTGQCSRMTLNYDFVFLALVRLAMSGEKVCFKQRRCFVHPLKKRNSMERNDVLDYCAAASALLNYHKIKDDLADERGLKKLRARIAQPFVAGARRRAIKRVPELSALDGQVSDRLTALAQTEKGNGSSVNAPAEQFGALLGDIMAFGLEGSDERIARELGRSIGAWIYIADAIEDMEQDIEKGRYNPFIRLYGGRLPQGDELTSISMAVRNQLYGAEAAVDLMEIESDTVRNIIQNIIYLGITERTDGIIKAYTKEEEKKKGETEND